jgi:hypothetical protein
MAKTLVEGLTTMTAHSLLVSRLHRPATTGGLASRQRRGIRPPFISPTGVCQGDALDRDILVPLSAIAVKVVYQGIPSGEAA